jgi:hypothetical protein
MSDFPDLRSPPPVALTSFHPESAGPRMSAAILVLSSAAAAAWPTANMAIYVPFKLAMPMMASQLFCTCGASPSGNIDIGIYSVTGVRLTSLGGVAQVATIQVGDITDLLLNPGHYFLALVLDNATGQIVRLAPTPGFCSFLGMYVQTSAYPLPATATFASASALVFIPVVGLTSKAVL